MHAQVVAAMSISNLIKISSTNEDLAYTNLDSCLGYLSFEIYTNDPD